MQKELGRYQLLVLRKKYKTDLHLKNIHLSPNHQLVDYFKIRIFALAVDDILKFGNPTLGNKN